MNHHARSLRTQQSDVVALLLGESVDRLFGDPNFARIVHGVSTALADAGLSMIILLSVLGVSASPELGWFGLRLGRQGRRWRRYAIRCAHP